jgi:diguanylate cyclase (GGDEF)-like protein/PAS domain S-box-containing protein
MSSAAPPPSAPAPLSPSQPAPGEAIYRTLVDNAVDIVLAADTDARFTYVSPSVEEVLGYTPEEMLGRTPADFIPPEDETARAQELATLAPDGTLLTGRFRARHKDGRILWLERLTRKTPQGSRVAFVTTIRDVTKAKEAEDTLAAANSQLIRLARFDGLTGIANRRHFDESLANEWRRAQRHDHPISLLMLDADYFKSYNDKNGHQQGDFCLVSIAKTLATFAQRPGDIAARYGGEEFALILPGCAEEAAREIAERVRAAIAALRLPHPGNLENGGVVTTSIGAATCHPGSFDSAHTPERLTKLADKMLYEAKRTGRNKVVALSSIASDITPLADPREAHRLAVVGKFARAANTYTTELDNIANMAAQIFKVPICFVSLIGSEQQLFLGRHGVPEETCPREISICAHTLTGSTPLILDNALEDPRFRNNPLVTGQPGIRFYASAPLMASSDGTNLGTLCIADRSPRQNFDDDQIKMLTALATFATNCMEPHTTPEPALETLEAAK